MDVFSKNGVKKQCIMMYLGNIHFMYMVPVTFENFFFNSSKHGLFLAKLKMFGGGFHHVRHLAPKSPSGFKEKITIGKKSSLTSKVKKGEEG